MDFGVPADDRVKLKKGEKRDKHFDLAWQLKQLWNMKMTVTPIVIGTFGHQKFNLILSLSINFSKSI